jgi:hypothetical protein
VNEDHHRLASESFRQAQAAFGRREYALAAGAFEQAAKFEAHPSPLLDAEEAWELAGEPVHAAEDCDRVLAIPGLERRFVVEAERRLKVLAAKVSTLEVLGPRTTTVRIDDGSDVVLPVRRRLAPGRHEIQMVDLSSSRTRTMTLELVAGESRILEQLGDGPPSAHPPETARAPMPSAPPTNVSPPPARSRQVPAASFVALGISAASAAIAIGFGVATIGAKRDYAAIPAQSTADTFQRDKIITNAAWGVAATAAIGAVVIWLVAPHKLYPAP